MAFYREPLATHCRRFHRLATNLKKALKMVSEDVRNLGLDRDYTDSAAGTQAIGYNRREFAARL